MEALEGTSLLSRKSIKKDSQLIARILMHPHNELVLCIYEVNYSKYNQASVDYNPATLWFCWGERDAKPGLWWWHCSWRQVRLPRLLGSHRRVFTAAWRKREAPVLRPEEVLQGSSEIRGCLWCEQPCLEQLRVVLVLVCGEGGSQSKSAPLPFHICFLDFRHFAPVPSLSLTLTHKKKARTEVHTSS